MKAKLLTLGSITSFTRLVSQFFCPGCLPGGLQIPVEDCTEVTKQWELSFRCFIVKLWTYEVPFYREVIFLCVNAKVWISVMKQNYSNYSNPLNVSLTRENLMLFRDLIKRSRLILDDSLGRGLSYPGFSPKTEPERGLCAGGWLRKWSQRTGRKDKGAKQRRRKIKRIDIELATVKLNPLAHSEETVITQEWGGS